MIIAVVCYTMLMICHGHSQDRANDPLLLGMQDYNAISVMFQSDFNHASDLWNSDYNDRRNYGEPFGEIVEKYGLAKFEHFMSLSGPMERYEGADHGMNCAFIDNFGGKEFENFSAYGMIFGRTKLEICFDYFSSGASKLDVGIKSPHPLT